jgi:hypothetical protein
MRSNAKGDLLAGREDKIVGVGLNKTGTGTLKTCLRHWGFAHATYDLDAFRLYRRNDRAGLQALMGRYDSFDNWPWALMFEEFDSLYPHARFILTQRVDAQTWYRSLCRHAKRFGPLTDFEQHIYGYVDPTRHEREHIEFYVRHNERVRDYFADRPDKLLVVCWESGDGWRELSNFLDQPTPELPFPHANKTPNLWNELEQRVRPVLGRYKQKLFGRR